MEVSLLGEILGDIILLIIFFGIPFFVTSLLEHSKEKLEVFEDEDED